MSDLDGLIDFEVGPDVFPVGEKERSSQSLAGRAGDSEPNRLWSVGRDGSTRRASRRTRDGNRTFSLLSATSYLAGEQIYKRQGEQESEASDGEGRLARDETIPAFGKTVGGGVVLEDGRFFVRWQTGVDWAGHPG